MNGTPAKNDTPSHGKAAPTLPALVAKRLGVLNRLYGLSERQRELAQTGEIQALLELLGLKQRVLGELEAVERELDPHRALAPEERQWSDQRQRLDCQRLIENCETRLAAIIRLDRESELIMLEKKDAAQKEIQKLNGQRASNAYVRQATNGSDSAPPSKKRLDLKSE